MELWGLRRRALKFADSGVRIIAEYLLQGYGRITSLTNSSIEYRGLRRSDGCSSKPGKICSVMSDLSSGNLGFLHIAPKTIIPKLALRIFPFGLRLLDEFVFRGKSERCSLSCRDGGATLLSGKSSMPERLYRRFPCFSTHEQSSPLHTEGEPRKSEMPVFGAICRKPRHGNWLPV
jgi:hypothetical protein